MQGAPARIGGKCAGVVKLVDAPDSKSGSVRSVGSIPTTRTILQIERSGRSSLALGVQSCSRWSAIGA